MVEPLTVRWAAPFTRGGEWMAAREELHQMGKTRERGKTTKLTGLAMWHRSEHFTRDGEPKEFTTTILVFLPTMNSGGLT